LNVINISIPPLRARKSDILPLCRDQLVRECRELGRTVSLSFSETVIRVLQLYEWPGNARELISLMSSLAENVKGDMVEVSDLPRSMRLLLFAEDKSDKSLQEIEVEHIRDVLQSCGDNKTRAAQVLGIDRKTLRDKLDRHNE